MRFVIREIERPGLFGTHTVWIWVLEVDGVPRCQSAASFRSRAQAVSSADDFPSVVNN